jgi:hypothetical protein
LFFRLQWRQKWIFHFWSPPLDKEDSKIAMNNAKDKQSLRAEFDSLLKDDGPLSRGVAGI